MTVRSNSCFLAGQRALHVREIDLVELGTEQVADVHPRHLLRRSAEPLDVGGGGHPVAEIEVPVADHDRQAVEDRQKQVGVGRHRPGRHDAGCGGNLGSS